MRFTVPSIAVGAAALLLAACGGGDSDDSTSSLAKYMPADALVYIEGTVRPDEDVSQNIDDISTKLTGSSVSEMIDPLLAEAQEGNVTYEEDVEPWLGENAAMYVAGDIAAPEAVSSIDGMDSIDGSTSSGTEDVGLVAETTDVDATQAFIDKSSEGEDVTDNEYEGFSYKISQDDNSAVGIVDDQLVFASSEEIFKKMVDASNGDNLEGTTAFSEVADKAADGSLVNFYVANEPIIQASQEGAGGEFDINQIYSSLGIDLTDTGTIFSLVPEADEIKFVGATNFESPFTAGDASEVLSSFPADSLFVTGVADIGSNVTKIIDTIDENGIEGILQPGELKKNIEESSGQGFDVMGTIESLETVGLFVSGTNERNIGGALVATTSDPEPVENALGAFSQILGLAQDAEVRPLGGGIAGFRVRTSELPGRPIVIGFKDDRLVVGVGMAQSMQALNGGGETVADTEAYQAAADSLSDESVDTFMNPDAISELVGSAVPGAEGAQIADVIQKFSYMVAATSDDNKEFEFNVGLKE